MREFAFDSQHDGLRIACANCEAENPRAALVIVHGMSEHKERYYPFMEYLSQNGIASVIEDHRGHGASAQAPEELGYFGENGADGLISDINTLTGIAAERYRGLPLFMLGHSMGALAARTFIQAHGEMLSGLIISGNPGYNAAASKGIKLCRAAQRRRGKHARCRLMTLGMFVPFVLRSRRFYSMNGWVCSDRETVRSYDADPLCGFEFQANGYEALLTLMLRAYDPHASAPNKALPVKFFSGADDACMGGRKGIENAAQLLRNAGYSDVSIKLYEKMGHEILNEKARQNVYADMLETLCGWMQDMPDKG